MPRVFECFPFFNELDMLEAHLRELSPVVDRFVLVEARQTFTGKAKPLHYAENKARFAKFADRIEHVIVDFPSDLSYMLNSKCYNEAWAREWYQRQQMGRGLREAAPSDLVIVTDVDEIISADALRRALSERRNGDLSVFTMPQYAYFVDRRRPGPDWTLGPRMLEARHFTDGQKVRMTKLHADRKMAGTPLGRLHTRAWNLVNCGISGRVVEIKNAGWHLSSIGSWQKFREKISAYAHFESMESGMYRDESEFIKSVHTETYEVDVSELPDFIRCSPAMFPRMRDCEHMAL